MVRKRAELNGEFEDLILARQLYRGACQELKKKKTGCWVSPTDFQFTPLPRQTTPSREVNGFIMVPHKVLTDYFGKVKTLDDESLLVNYLLGSLSLQVGTNFGLHMGSIKSGLTQALGPVIIPGFAESGRRFSTDNFHIIAATCMAKSALVLPPYEPIAFGRLYVEDTSQALSHDVVVKLLPQFGCEGILIDERGLMRIPMSSEYFRITNPTLDMTLISKVKARDRVKLDEHLGLVGTSSIDEPGYWLSQTRPIKVPDDVCMVIDRDVREPGTRTTELQLDSRYIDASFAGPIRTETWTDHNKMEGIWVRVYRYKKI